MDRDLQLIHSVQANKIIYDKSMFGFKDLALKEKIWEAIGERLGDPAEHCQQRWRVLRDRYAKEKRSKELREKNGNSTESIWPLYNDMGFLDDYITRRRPKFYYRTQPTESPPDSFQNAEFDQSFDPTTSNSNPETSPLPLLSPKVEPAESPEPPPLVQVIPTKKRRTMDTSTPETSTRMQIGDPLGLVNFTEGLGPAEDSEEAVHFSRTVQVMILKLLRENPDKKFEIMMDVLELTRNLTAKYER